MGEYYKTPKNEVWINNETKSNYQTWGLSLASFSVEPRVNMINIRDYASVSLNMPVNFSISFEDNGIGYFHFTLPLLLNLNLFYHSTYNNIVYKGLSFGIGAQYIAAPLFKTENFHYITSWIQPLLRFQYKFQNKSRNKGSSIGFRVGLLKGEYFRISFGKILFY